MWNLFWHTAYVCLLVGLAGASPAPTPTPLPTNACFSFAQRMDQIRTQVAGFTSALVDELTTLSTDSPAAPFDLGVDPTSIAELFVPVLNVQNCDDEAAWASQQSVDGVVIEYQNPAGQEALKLTIDKTFTTTSSVSSSSLNPTLSSFGLTFDEPSFSMTSTIHATAVVIWLDDQEGGDLTVEFQTPLTIAIAQVLASGGPSISGYSVTAPTLKINTALSTPAGSISLTEPIAWPTQLTGSGDITGSLLLGFGGSSQHPLYVSFAYSNYFDGLASPTLVHEVVLDSGSNSDMAQAFVTSVSQLPNAHWDKAAILDENIPLFQGTVNRMFKDMNPLNQSIQEDLAALSMILSSNFVNLSSVAPLARFALNGTSTGPFDIHGKANANPLILLSSSFHASTGLTISLEYGTTVCLEGALKMDWVRTAPNLQGLIFFGGGDTRARGCVSLHVEIDFIIVDLSPLTIDVNVLDFAVRARIFNPNSLSFPVAVGEVIDGFAGASPETVDINIAVEFPTGTRPLADLSASAMSDTPDIIVFPIDFTLSSSFPGIAADLTDIHATMTVPSAFSKDYSVDSNLPNLLKYGFLTTDNILVNVGAVSALMSHHLTDPSSMMQFPVGVTNFKAQDTVPWNDAFDQLANMLHAARDSLHTTYILTSPNTMQLSSDLPFNPKAVLVVDSLRYPFEISSPFGINEFQTSLNSAISSVPNTTFTKLVSATVSSVDGKLQVAFVVAGVNLPSINIEGPVNFGFSSGACWAISTGPSATSFLSRTMCAYAVARGGVCEDITVHLDSQKFYITDLGFSLQAVPPNVTQLVFNHILPDGVSHIGCVQQVTLSAQMTSTINWGANFQFDRQIIPFKYTLAALNDNDTVPFSVQFEGETPIDLTVALTNNNNVDDVIADLASVLPEYTLTNLVNEPLPTFSIEKTGVLGLARLWQPVNYSGSNPLGLPTRPTSTDFVLLQSQLLEYFYGSLDVTTALSIDIPNPVTCSFLIGPVDSFSEFGVIAFGPNAKIQISLVDPTPMDNKITYIDLERAYDAGQTFFTAALSAPMTMGFTNIQSQMIDWITTAQGSPPTDALVALAISDTPIDLLQTATYNPTYYMDNGLVAIEVLPVALLQSSAFCVNDFLSAMIDSVSFVDPFIEKSDVSFLDARLPLLDTTLRDELKLFGIVSQYGDDVRGAVYSTQWDGKIDRDTGDVCNAGGSLDMFEMEIEKALGIWPTQPDPNCFGSCRFSINPVWYDDRSNGLNLHYLNIHADLRPPKNAPDGWPSNIRYATDTVTFNQTLKVPLDMLSFTTDISGTTNVQPFASRGLSFSQKVLQVVVSNPRFVLDLAIAPRSDNLDIPALSLLGGSGFYVEFLATADAQCKRCLPAGLTVLDGTVSASLGSGNSGESLQASVTLTSTPDEKVSLDTVVEVTGSGDYFFALAGVANVQVFIQGLSSAPILSFQIDNMQGIALYNQQKLLQAKGGDAVSAPVPTLSICSLTTTGTATGDCAPNDFIFSSFPSAADLFTAVFQGNQSNGPLAIFLDPTKPLGNIKKMFAKVDQMVDSVDSYFQGIKHIPVLGSLADELQMVLHLLWNSWADPFIDQINYVIRGGERLFDGRGDLFLAAAIQYNVFKPLREGFIATINAILDSLGETMSDSVKSIFDYIENKIDESFNPQIELIHYDASDAQIGYVDGADLEAAWEHKESNGGITDGQWPDEFHLDDAYANNLHSVDFRIGMSMDFFEFYLQPPDIDLNIPLFELSLHTPLYVDLKFIADFTFGIDKDIGTYMREGTGDSPLQFGLELIVKPNNKDGTDPGTLKGSFFLNKLTATDNNSRRLYLRSPDFGRTR
jgi:hypothetical protein